MASSPADESPPNGGSSPRGTRSTIRPNPARPGAVAGQTDLMLTARPSPLLRAVFARLQERGLSIVATSPARAVARLQEDPPRLVVMDLAACSIPELVGTTHSLAIPIAVLGTSMRSRSSFVARSLGARHLLTPSPSIEAVTRSILDCIEAESKGLSTLDLPFETTLSELQ